MRYSDFRYSILKYSAQVVIALLFRYSTLTYSKFNHSPQNAIYYSKLKYSNITY
jgi:hypothetical protein